MAKHRLLHTDKGHPLSHLSPYRDVEARIALDGLEMDTGIGSGIGLLRLRRNV